MGPYTKTFSVRWADCDLNGHMRNTAYSEYAIDIRVAFLSEHGFGVDRMLEMGFGPVILREEIDYLREVHLGDTVRVDVAIVGLSPECGRFRFAHEFEKENGKACARIVLAGAWLDLRERRLRPPPEPLAAVLRTYPRREAFEELPALGARP